MAKIHRLVVVALVWGGVLGTSVAGEEASRLISSFESKAEFLRWEKLRLPVQREHQVMGLERSKIGATAGTYAIKINQPLKKQRISWGLAEGVPRDWSGWQEIAFDVTYAGEGLGETVGVSLVVDDWRSTAEWKDVFHRGFRIRKGTQTCRVSIHELATKIDVRRIRQITFTHSGKGPATWYMDNIRLVGKRTVAFQQTTPGFRIKLPEAERFRWVMGDDFRRFQIVGDGYYEPKGWMPSRENIAKMSGLTFTEYSTRAPGRENARIVLQLKKSVPPLTAKAGEALRAPGKTDVTILPQVAGSVEFWITPTQNTIEQTGAQTFLHAVADLENQVKIGFWDGDLFFEVRTKGERKIVRYWDHTIWGDIRKAPARFRAGEPHHIRVTWGAAGMYLNVDDEEVPYNLFKIHRKPEHLPAPSPYMGGLPSGLNTLMIGSNVDGSGKTKILMSKVLITGNGKRGARWGGLDYVKRGEYVSQAMDRGSRFAEKAFTMTRFMATANVPPKTSVRWQIATLATAKDARPTWQDIQPGDTVPAAFNRNRYLQVRAMITGDGKATPEVDEWHIIQFNPVHPRLFLTQKKIKTIRQRVKSGSLKILFEKLLAVAPERRGFLHNAFLYYLTQDEKYKEEAKADFIAAKAKKKVGEHWDIVGAEWQLGFLQGEARQKMLAHIASRIDRGIPRDNIYWNQSMNGWRHALHRGIVTNVALVGEEGPWVHDARHSFRSYEDFIKAWMIPAFNQVGGVWPEGFGYHSYTGAGPVLALTAWQNLTGENLWPKAAPFFKNLGAWYAYSRQPHTNAAVHVNDDSGRTRWLIYSWTNILADVYGDPWLQKDAMKMLAGMVKTKYWRTREGIRDPEKKKGVMGYFDLLTWLLDFNPAVQPVDLTQQPRARYFRGMDWMTTRSDWSKDATFICFIPYDWYGGHKQTDTGSFLISKGGELVDDPRDGRPFSKPQHFGYRIKSAAHNVLYAGAPDVLKLGDGGQITNGMPLPNEVIPDSRFDTATTLAFRDTKHYTWMSADLTGAYRVDRVGGIRRVQKYVRSILFLRPDVIVVHDRVKPTAAASRFAFVLHNSENEPQVSGDGKKLDDLVVQYAGAPLTMLAGGRGRLFSQALAPKSLRTIKRKVTGMSKGKLLDMATVWQVEYEPLTVTPGKWIDFLVVMRAGIGEGTKPAVSSLTKDDNGNLVTTIKVDGDEWTVRLSTTEDATGHVRLKRDDKIQVDEKLQRSDFLIDTQRE